MKFLLYLCFGYVRLVLPADRLKDVLNFANSRGVRLLKIRSDDCAAKIYFSLRDEKQFLDFFHDAQIEYDIDGRVGVPVLWRRYRTDFVFRRYLYFAAFYLGNQYYWVRPAKQRRCMRIVGAARGKNRRICAVN